MEKQMGKINGKINIKAKIIAAPHDPDKPDKISLTHEDARQMVRDWVSAIPKNSPEWLSIRVALANPELKIWIVDSADVNLYVGRTESDSRKARGFSYNKREEILIAGRSEKAFLAFLEEAGHNVIKNTYSGKHHRPWTGHKTESRDIRKTLFEQATAKDIENSGLGKVAFTRQLRRDLGMETYPDEKLPEEIVAKTMKMKAAGLWTEELGRKYKNLEEFYTYIMLKDIETRARGEALPKIPDVLQKREQPRTQDNIVVDYEPVLEMALDEEDERRNNQEEKKVEEVTQEHPEESNQSEAKEPEEKKQSPERQPEQQPEQNAQEELQTDNSSQRPEPDINTAIQSAETAVKPETPHTEIVSEVDTRQNEQNTLPEKQGTQDIPEQTIPVIPPEEQPVPAILEQPAPVKTSSSKAQAIKIESKSSQEAKKFAFWSMVSMGIGVLGAMAAPFTGLILFLPSIIVSLKGMWHGGTYLYESVKKRAELETNPQEQNVINTEVGDSSQSNTQSYQVYETKLGQSCKKFVKWNVVSFATGIAGMGIVLAGGLLTGSAAVMLAAALVAGIATAVPSGVATWFGANALYNMFANKGEEAKVTDERKIKGPYSAMIKKEIERAEKRNQSIEGRT